MEGGARASGTGVPRSMEEAPVESLSKALTGTNGSQSATSQCRWVLVRLWPPEWWVSVFLRASWISSYTSLSAENINQCIEHIYQKSLMVFVRKSRNFKAFGKVGDIDLVLRKRASQRLDVERNRHSDTRDSRLAFSVILPEHLLWACSQPILLLASALVARHQRERWELDKKCALVDRWIRGGVG